MANQPTGALHLTAQLQTSLQTNKSLHPTASWLSSFLATQRANVTLPALVSTASFRLLASNITTTLSKAPPYVLPLDIQDVKIKERKLPPGPIVVQVIDVEDIGQSRWAQIEAIDALSRGENTVGREIVRVEVPEVNEGVDVLTTPATIVTGLRPGSGVGSGAGTGAGAGVGAAARTAAVPPKSSGPHKVLLQDARGGVVQGIELKTIKGIGLGMAVGGKLVLNGCDIARGVVLLNPLTVEILGGKIDALHTAWVSGKKERLEALIEAVAQEEGQDEH